MEKTVPLRVQRVLIVEDERAVARGLEYGLRDAGFDVQWAANGESALSMLATDAPDLILLDIRMPGMDGFEVLRTLRAQGHRQPVLMLTARDEEVDKVLGLELGADDYVVKPFSLRELTSRIRALLRRAYGELAGPADGRPLRFGDFTLDPSRFTLRKGDVVVELTPTELRLLAYMAANAGRPISRSELIEAVWGYASDIGSDRTVDVHIRHLREKIEEDPGTPHWIVTVRGAGYLMSETEAL
jgi:two-component system alkaline phosphatase synthesis response regulator PhoP